jgi:hypothetical protein
MSRPFASDAASGTGHRHGVVAVRHGAGGRIEVAGNDGRPSAREHVTVQPLGVLDHALGAIAALESHATIGAHALRRRGVGEERRPSASPSAAGAEGGTTSPVRPSATTSAVPPTRVATTGRAARIASSSVTDKPSRTDESTNTSDAASSSATSSLGPRNRTASSSPSRDVCARSSASSGPLPATSSTAPRHRRARQHEMLRADRAAPSAA